MKIAVERRTKSRTVKWSQLSPRGRAIVAQIGLRLEAGYSNAEVAQMLNVARPELEALPLPSPVTEEWVAECVKELRKEIEAQ